MLFIKHINKMWLLSSKPIFWGTLLTTWSLVIKGFLLKNEDGEQHSVQYFEKFIHITGKPYTHRYISHVLLNKMIASWTLKLKNKESCALFSVQKDHEIGILDVPLPLLAQCTYYGLYMEFLKIMFFQSYFSFSQRLWVTSSWNLAWMCKWFNSN